MLKGNEKVLILKPSSLGDIVHSLAFLNSLKESYPELKIHWVVAKGFEDLLESHQMIEKIFIINKDSWKSIKNLFETLREFFNLSKNLKKEDYDLVVDLQGLLRSGIISWLSKAPLRVGFREAREFSFLFYNKKISAPINQHAVYRYLKIAENLGARTDLIKFPLPDPIEPSWLNNFKDFVTIIPSARWQSKKWPLPYFVELIKMLPYDCLIVGSNSDQSDALRIEEYTEGKAKSIAGKTNLRELIAVFNKTRFVISPDTGTMHLAAACGKRVIALFGPTNPQRTGPFGEGHLVFTPELNCSPCFKKKCEEQKCMRSITPEMVYNRIKELNL